MKCNLSPFPARASDASNVSSLICDKVLTLFSELSKNNRAGCQNKGCKDNAVKISKGELRFANMVTIRDHDSWMYRHW